MIWVLYNVLFTIGFLVLLPHYFLRMKRRGGYAQHFWQRVGRYEPEVLARLKGGRRLWVHAVSVGELFIAIKLMEQLRERDPQLRFVLTVTTSTAHAIAVEQLSDLDVLLYFPVDFPPVTRRVLKLINPSALVLMECELWPNTIRLTHAGGAPVVVVNGRISQRSYQGYRKLRVFTRRILPMVDLVCAQSRSDAERFIGLGADPTKVKVLGSAKYELGGRDGAGEGQVDAVLQAAGIGPDSLVVLGGSTWSGEEAALLDIHNVLRQKRAQLALVLVPRHFERADEVVEEIRSRGLVPLLRTTVEPGGETLPPDSSRILLVNTTGELKNFYVRADVIFVGKSLANHGGQNIIEPAAYGKAVVVGPNMENFPVVMDDFLGADAVVQVPDEQGLEEALTGLLDDEDRRRTLGERAARLVEEKQGALTTTADLLTGLIPSASPPANG